MHVSGTAREWRRTLEDLHRSLGEIHSTVTVVVAALRQQASGLDEDMASVLARGAGDRIQDEIERVEAALGRLRTSG